MQTASRRRRIARGAGRNEVDVTNMIGTFGGMRSKMQSLSKMMKAGGGGGGETPQTPKHEGCLHGCMQARKSLLDGLSALQLNQGALTMRCA